MSGSAPLTPAAVAGLLRVKPHTVLGWIKAGELAAFDLRRKPGHGRPRYRIEPDAVEEFKRRRAVRPAVKTPRRKQPQHVIEFY